MPTLDRATREALTESIREHGVIVPVVKDQTGYVLDGYNRIEIAEALGVEFPEVVYECEPEQRDILAIELNGARRQLHDDQWKPLVDHLRALNYSDRVIAKAVGVSRERVRKYKSPDTSTDTAVSVEPKKTVGEDNKTRTVGGEWTATDRVLHLVRQSTSGLTTDDLRRDEILAQFGGSTIGRLPGALRDRGLLEEAGRHGRVIVWRAVEPPEPVTQSPTLRRKAERAIELLRDPQVRSEAQAVLADSKEVRTLVKLARDVDKEDEAARTAEEKERAEAEREEIRRAQILRDQPGKSLEYWDQLCTSVDAAAEVLARYMREYDFFPPILPADVRRLDDALERLRQQMHRFEKRLHPQGKRSVDENVINL